MKKTPSNNLISRPSGEVKVARASNIPVISRMTKDFLVKTRPPEPKQSQYRIEGYELRAADYRQIFRWARDLSMTPSVVLWHLEQGDLKIDDGTILRIDWNFNHLPLIPEWEEGLLIEELSFDGDWPDPNVPLKPNLPKLKKLGSSSARFGKLKYLELSGVPELTKLGCAGNQLTELDLSPVPDLDLLVCSNNQLTELDLYPVQGLTELGCSGNQLTKLDLSPVPDLTKLFCFNNQLAQLDLSPVPKLTTLVCSGNQLAELDLSPVQGLTLLECSNNQLTELDLSPVQGLTYLFCILNQLTELDLSPVPSLANPVCDTSVQVHRNKQNVTR